MVRWDHLGVTAVIRDLALRHDCYETMMHFFRSTAVSLEQIVVCWFEAVKTYAPLYRENNTYILIGDGVKTSKEGYFMPGVKKLHQESENSSKAEYIYGHMFGGLGVLAGSVRKWFCIPLRINIQDGLQATASWEGSTASTESHVVQMIRGGFYAASTAFGKSILLLDRYFLTIPALLTLNALNQGVALLQIVTKAKCSCVAYEKAPKYCGRGRPPVKGKPVKIGSLFDSESDKFQKAQTFIYGKLETVEYYSIDLLWGKGLYQPLRFVLIKFKGMNSIFVSTDLTLSPLAIIRLYSYRFNTECCFREFKQCLGGFCYHFWTMATPKLNHFLKKESADPLTSVKDKTRQVNCTHEIGHRNL